MQMNGLARLGRDAEVRTLQSGDQVANLSLAFSYGKKGSDGNRPTQWVDASIWGKRAESLAPFLKKGSVHLFYLADVHIETYQGRNGEGHKLVANVTDIDLGPRVSGGDGGQQQSAAAPAPAQRTQAAAPPPPQRAASGFDDMDDDIPF